MVANFFIGQKSLWSRLIRLWSQLFLGKNPMWSFIPLWSQFFPLKSILIICIIFWAFLLCTMYTMYKTFESWGNFDRKDKNLLLQWQFVVRREFKKVWSLFKLWLQIGFQTKCSYGRLLEYGRNLFLQNLSLWSLIRIWSFIRYSRVIIYLVFTRLHTPNAFALMTSFKSLSNNSW